MLGQPVSQTLLGSQLHMLAQSHLEQARVQKAMQHLEMALFLYDQAKVSFKHATDAYKLAPPLSEVKDAFDKARTPQSAEAQTLRQRIAQVYFERAELLIQLGKADKAQASSRKAQAWGHPDAAAWLSHLSVSASADSLSKYHAVAAQAGKTLSSIARTSSPISADIPSTLAEPAKNAARPPHLTKVIREKNKLVELLFTKTLETFQQCKVSSVWPSAFLVYAHDNHHVGIAEAGTAKFLIHHLGELGVNLYSDQKPKGKQTQASFSTRADTARLDDILTSQLCLLPTAIGTIQPVDKVIVCGSQVLAHYLQWGEAGQHYQSYCAELKAAYGLAQQNVTQAEAEIRKVVSIYSKKADFHHVLTEMAFLKIRTDYLEQHGIIPVSLSAGGYESCLQDFIEATTVRIEDMTRFASKQASGEVVYENQGRHLVFFKVLERLLAQHDTEALLSTFWTGYADWIKRLNNEAAVPTASAYLPVWDGITQQAQRALTALQEKVDAHELRTALTHYASLDRLAIQRLSGPPLSMKHCYINLAIVEHQKAPKEEEKPKEGDAAQNHFHRLPSFEAIDSNPQKLVPLEKLFDPRELSDGNTVTPQRILIRGRAGVGKTTLSKKIVYEYTQKAQWRDRFDWLFWIPLRALKGKSSCDLATLFHETYFQSHPNGQTLAKTLEAHISGPAKNKTLFVLDGWDEIAQEWGEHEPMSGFLKQLLNQPAVLITSRPYVELKQTQAMDLELETVGFSPENVTAYLDNRDVITASDAKEIKHFIQTNAFIQGLVNVPIQLDALCYSWDEIKRMQKEMPGTMTVTALYQAMMNKLWRKDMLRLGKREGGELLTESHVNALERPSRIEKLVQAEHHFLSTLAFRGLQRNQIEFHHRDLHALIEQLEAQGVNLPLTLEANLKKLSFLHTDDAEESQRSYHFMHLTYQEFFAAKHFVAHWEAGREITLLSIDTKMWIKATPEAFVRQYKYNPRYEILWWLVAGLLRGEALNRFFILLETEPRDLLGAHHQRLIMSCLHEASRTPGVGLPSEIRDRLEQGLAQWLQLEIDKREESTLAYQPIFPEHLLLQCLQKTTSAQTKRAVAIAFKHRPLSEAALLALIALAKDKDENETMRRSAVDALSQHSSLPESALQTLIALAKDENKNVRSSAVDALGQQSSLPESVLLTLIALAKDENKNVRSSAVDALGQHSSLPKLALLPLIALLKNENEYVRRGAADVLGKQTSLPESALLPLIALAKDEGEDVRRGAAEALGKHSSLPESALLALIALLKDVDLDVSRRAADALEKHSSLPESALQALIALAKDWEGDVRYRAASALGKQPSLPESALQALIVLLKDVDWDVRRRAADALGKQSSLPESALQALIALLKDVDWDVRRRAVDALGKQSSLPESALQALIALAKDENEDVRSCAAEALGKHSSLPESALLALIALLKDRDVRRRAADALGQQLSLPESALQALIALLKDENEYVRGCAAEALGKQTSLPESAMQALIALAKDANEYVRRHAADALGQQSSLPESVLLTLIALANDANDGVRCHAVDMLGKQSQLPESALMALIALTKDEYRDVRRSAADALGKPSSLSESALLALIALANDANEDVRCHAVDMLGKQSPLPESALQALLALAKDVGGDVRRRAADALGKQSSLPEPALQALIALTKDEDWDVKCHAADALGKQSSLPESALQALLALAKDENEYVRRRAADMLGKQSPLPESALQALLALAKDEDRDVRRRAADMLRKQSPLPESALLALLALAKDENWYGRRRAADMLGKQSPLPESALLALIALAKDADGDGDVRRHAADVLGMQSSLPESALLALIALTKDGDVRRRAADALGKHRSTFYRLLPTLNRQKIEWIYKEYLVEQRFDQSAPLYIQDSTLHFYTAQGLQTVPFQDPDQEAEFRQAVQQAQQAAGIPFAHYLSTRDQVEQLDTQNGEET